MFRYHIQTITVGASGSSEITFSSIPQIYDDLYIVFSTRTSRANHSDEIDIKFNNTTSGLTSRYLSGDGVSTGSGTLSIMFAGYAASAHASANTFGTGQVLITNYRTSDPKSISADGVGENNGTYSARLIGAGVWNSSQPINSITLYSDSNSTILQYSSASLYGIKRGADGVTLPAAYGGTVTTSGGYTYHTFTTSGTFTATKNLQVEALVIAGGGGSSDNVGAGSGAGGVLSSSVAISAAAYPVLIGAGGVGAGGPGNNGANSTALGLTAIGGGRGGIWTNGAGQSGGSGGGGAGYSGAGGAGTAGQGFAGGSGSGGPTYGGSGGGGGAGGVGGNASGASGGTGGAGTFAYSTWATATGTGVDGVYAGGGGGGAYNSSFSGTYPGGTGGGGTGTGNNSASGGNGVANTGSGGGGGGPNGGDGGSGGSGIVIIRYPTPA